MYSNQEILDGLIRNDQTIIRNIYKSQYPIISGWIKRNNGSLEDSNDILQEAFFIILRKLKAEGIELECNFSTYLFAICKNLWFKELRDRSRIRPTELEEFNRIADENSIEELEERKLCIYLEQINLLEEKCRQLLLLYCEKKSLTDIMQLLGFKNPQAVADKKKNCRKRLIENLLNCREYKELQSEIFIAY